MRPIILKGQERAITDLKYNRDSDLIFTTSKDSKFCVWFTDNGERLGIFSGHRSAVWAVDVQADSQSCISGSADFAAKLWSVENGKEIFSFAHKAPVRTVEFGVGDRQFLSMADGVFGEAPSVFVWDVNGGGNRPAIQIALQSESKDKINFASATFGPLNKTIVASTEDGIIRVYDVRNTAAPVKTITDHTKNVNQVSMNPEKTLFITASRDATAKLYDAYDFECLKTYNFERPLNTASISPLREEVLLGGGADAVGITTTKAGANQFRCKFFHLIFEEEIGSISGHFGPVNILSYSTDGKGFATGGEDGYVRLHHFDKSYFNRRN
eukprot:TRINITY_DN1988_c0_g1_i1.p1 TRINITY_DN1988_c0_g1~~TRINITY_DN1988_c0_g1_i1.p1  ORF type:complete len:326 (-),score=87.27 TRINITY_DN1988_c0_g1_i1:238-1215(-)